MFNIYILDIPATKSNHNGYADDFAMSYAHKKWERIEEVMSANSAILCDYFDEWRLTISRKKSVATMFHLNNRDANRQMNITAGPTRVKIEPNSTYLGVVLDRSLT